MPQRLCREIDARGCQLLQAGPLHTDRPGEPAGDLQGGGEDRPRPPTSAGASRRGPNGSPLRPCLPPALASRWPDLLTPHPTSTGLRELLPASYIFND